MPRQKFGTLYTVHLCYGKDHTHLVTEVSSKKDFTNKDTKCAIRNSHQHKTIQKSSLTPRKLHEQPLNVGTNCLTFRVEESGKEKERDVGLMLPIG